MSGANVVCPERSRYSFAMRAFAFVWLFGLGLFATGCRGKAIATAELHGPGIADARFVSTGGDVVLWADTDGKWSGVASKHARFPAHYDIDVFSQGKPLTHLVCDTRDTSEAVCGSRTSSGEEHEGDCELRLECVVPTIPAGDASIHVVGSPGVGVTEVKKMSINVRAK